MPIDKLLSGLIGGGARRREETEAREALNAARADIDDFKYSTDPTNPYADQTNAFAGLTNSYQDLTNPFADLKVNTQAAEFQAEQNNQNQANILDALVQGGASAGATATALAAQATNANREISADIGRQEAANQQLAASGEQSRQQALAQGDANVQQLIAQGEQHRQNQFGLGQQYMLDTYEARDATRYEWLGTQYGEASQRLKDAQAARAQATQNLFSGIGGLATNALTGGLIGGGSGLGGVANTLLTGAKYNRG